MILYLIRHGKTDAHIENKRQSPSTPLGELGKKQAQALADKMHLTKIDHLYSSDWPRAIATAEYIATSLSREVKIHPLVHEIQRNSDLDGVSDKSELNLRYTKEILENRDNFDWKFEGKGESLNEVIKRAKDVINFLEDSHSEETIVIVSHGIFLSVLIVLIMLGFNYDQRSFRKLLWTLKIDNTGVTKFNFDSKQKYWIMERFNDTSHLDI